jgi:hypothetical protein
VVEHLGAGDTYRLLEGTPRGICQLGTLLYGPLGIFESAECRIVGPSLNICLWHCSDPGCQAPHHVQLEKSDLSFLRLKKDLERFLFDHVGRPSRWDVVFGRILRGYGPFDQPAPGKYSNLPEILAGSLVQTELSALFSIACSHPRSAEQVRNTIAAIRGRKLANASSDFLNTKITYDEQLQLLLTLKDTELISLLDEAV